VCTLLSQLTVDSNINEKSYGLQTPGIGQTASFVIKQPGYQLNTYDVKSNYIQCTQTEHKNYWVLDPTPMRDPEPQNCDPSTKTQHPTPLIRQPLPKT